MRKLLKTYLYLFSFDFLFQCSAYLSEWTALNKAVKDEASNDVDNIWKNSWYALCKLVVVFSQLGEETT